MVSDLVEPSPYLGLVLTSAICLNQDSQDAQDKAKFFNPVDLFILIILSYK